MTHNVCTHYAAVLRTTNRQIVREQNGGVNSIRRAKSCFNMALVRSERRNACCYVQ